MKLVLLLAALAVVASGFSHGNLYLGYFEPGDRLLARSTVYKWPLADTIQSQDVAYYGNATNRISAIQAVEIGISQGARASLFSGGIGSNKATIRLETSRGGGFNYKVEFYGR